MKFIELEVSLRMTILPKLREYFNKVSFEDRSNWIMKIFYGHKIIFESFETYELDPFLEEEAFEQKKLRLFLDGVCLYNIKNKNIQLICDCDGKDYYKYR